MTLKGDLDSISLADVFQTLSMTQQEGTLHVHEGENRKAIFFSKDGVRLIHTGEKKGGKLGDMLVGLGKITQEQLEQALSLQRQQEGAKLGEVLTQLGFVTAKDIEGAVRSQIEEEIYDLFSWEGASFEFMEGAPKDGTFEAEGLPVTQLTFNINSLIMEAARRIDEWDLIEKAIPSLQEIFQLTKRVNPLEYTDQERVILRLVDGRRSVKDIVEESHVPKFDVCKFLYRLIEQQKATRTVFEQLMAMGDEAVRAENLQDGVKFYEQALSGKVKKKSDQLKARQRLAQALEYLDRKKEAADQYKLLADAKVEDKDVEGAINIWQKVIDLNPLDLENKERLINVYLQNREALDPNRSDVIRSLEYSLFKNGKSLAMAFAYAGQIDRAKEVLTRLLELTPSNVELRKALANIHFDAGEKAEAVEELDKVAQFLLTNRDYPELLEAYKKILKIDPSRGDVRKKIGMIEAGEGVAAGTPARRGHLGRNLLLASLLLLILGGAGALVWYEVTALGEWRKTSEEAEAVWRKSMDVQTPDLEVQRPILRGQAREAIQGVSDRFPYTPLPGRARLLAARWDQEEEDEREQMEAVLLTQAKAVYNLRIQMEKVDQDSGPLDLDAVRPSIRTALREATRNPHAKEDLKILEDLLRKFEAKRLGAETLLGEARAAEQAADASGQYREQFGTAWSKWAALHGAAQRFPDLLEPIRLPLRVETDPPGAQAFLNGEGPMKTPFTHRIRPGEKEGFVLRLVLRGYQTLEIPVPALDWAQIQAREGDVLWVLRYPLSIVELCEALYVDLGGEKLKSDPVAAGGNLYFAVEFGRALSLRFEEERLKQAWSVPRISDDPLRRGFITRLLASSDSVYFPCEDGCVYGLPLGGVPGSGKAFSRFDPSGPEGATFTIRDRAGVALSEDGTVLVAGSDLGLTAFEIPGGKVLWRFLLKESGNRACAVPVCRQGKVYAGLDSGELLAIDLKTGPKDEAPLWRMRAANSPIRSALAVYGDVLYAGTENGNLVACDLAKVEAGAAAGAGIATRLVGAPVQGKPLFAGGLVHFAAGGTLYAYEFRRDESSLREAWQLPLGGRSGRLVEPVLVGPSLFLGNEDGAMISVDWAARKVRWERKSPGRMKVPPAADRDGTVFFVCEDRKGILVHVFKE